jgi:hypothetical protein
MTALAPTPEQLQQWGASMREIDPSSLNKDEDGASVRWFLGDNGTELFAWCHGANPPHHLQLVFARVSVEWEDKRGLMTGAFKGGSSTAGGRYDPYLLSTGAQANTEVSQSALTLLKASKVPAELIAPLVGALEKAV